MKSLPRLTAAMIALVLTLTLLSLPAAAQDTAAPRLTSLSLDGGYSLDFSPEQYNYTVFLPSGRPRIPRLSATAPDGVTVRVYKAALADGENDGYGYVTATADGMTSVYRVHFIRSAELGFVLQYDDVYTFDHGLEGKISFSSDSPAATVSTTGVITAKAVTDSPITITATSDSGTSATLKIDKIVKAQIDIVMSAGQSNAYGRGGDAALSERVKPGTAYDIGYDGNTQAANSNTNPISLATTAGTGTAVPGVRGSFANEWYSTTGEKILFINAADPGINIAAWQANGATYVGAKKEYNRVKALMADNDRFEIYREFFYFNHGSADTGSNFNADYYAKVTATFNNLLTEMDFEFGTIFEYFSSDRAYTSWIRSQHNRIVSEMDNIYMGCEMKPYIQADPELINSDNLHLSQAGHNLCGRLMAQNTAAQALAPDCKYPDGAVAVPASAPALSWDFNGSLTPNAGSITLELRDGAEKYTQDTTALTFTDGVTWYAMSEPIRLRTTSDWLIEFTMRLEGDSKQFAVIGSPDNSAQVYINLSDGTTKGFKVRYGATGNEGTAITLSVRNTDDLYTMNTWRLYYRAELNLLYLYRDGELQSTEILPGPMTLSQIGRTGSITTAGKFASLDSLRVWYNRQESGSYSFDFENTLTEQNGLVTLSAQGGSFGAESVQLKYASNNFSFDEIQLSPSYDWTFEVRGTFSKNTGILNSADGSNTIFANVSDPGFRVRLSSSQYVKLTVSPADFTQPHTWRIDYNASAGTVTLFRDGVSVASKAMNSALKFTNSGVSGTAGASNSALIDYILVEQKGVNRGTGDRIIFNFNNSLTDDSGNYTMTAIKGSVNFVQSDFGYVFDDATRLTLSSPIVFGDNSFELDLRADFSSNGDIIPGILSVGDSGFTFGGQAVDVSDPSWLRSANNWKFSFDRKSGKLTLTQPNGTDVSCQKSAGTYSFGSLGGAVMSLYSLELRVEDGKEQAVRAAVGVSESAGTYRAEVTSDIWDIGSVTLCYQWLRDGHVIPGAVTDSYIPTLDDVGSILSCRLILRGTPDSGEGTSATAVVLSTQVLPTPPTPTTPDTTAPVTPDTTAPGTTGDPAVTTDSSTTAAGEKKGCGSIIALGIMGILIPAALVIKKKRSEI